MNKPTQELQTALLHCNRGSQLDLERHSDQRCDWFSLTHLHTHTRRRPGSWRPTSEGRETLMTQSNKCKITHNRIHTTDRNEHTHKREQGSFLCVCVCVYLCMCTVCSHMFTWIAVIYHLLQNLNPYREKCFHGTQRGHTTGSSYNAGVHTHRYTAQYIHTHMHTHWDCFKAEKLNSN